MKYIFNNVEVGLSDFLYEYGDNYILIAENNSENTLLILEKTRKTLSEIFKKYLNKEVFISNISTNVFLSLKEYFIPYKIPTIPEDIPEYIDDKLYGIDFVYMQYKDSGLEIVREENYSKTIIDFDSEEKCKNSLGLKNIGPHIILKKKKNNKIFIPLYSIEFKSFYNSGVRCVSPFNLVK